MRRLTLVLCVLLLSGLFGGCAETPARDGAFRFSLTAEPVCLDPQIARDEASLTVIASLFEGLTTLDNGHPVPAAADWTVAEDGLCYVFSLFASKWSDGTAVTADDFLFAYERTMDEATGSPHRAALSNIQQVTAQDETTLRVTLKTADADFLARLADGVWYPCPRAPFAAAGGGWGMEAKTLCTNGAFSLAAWTHKESLLLRRHEDYHAAAEIAPATVRYVIMSPDDGATALADGSLDAALLTDSAAMSNTVAVEDTVAYLWFNTSLSPLDSAAVRTALRDAVEWDTVNAALLRTPTASYVAAASIWQEVPYTSPLALHRTAPDRAAFADMLEAPCPTLTLLCGEGAEALTLAQYIVQSWQKNLAVYFTVEQVPTATLRARLTAGNYHLAIAPATAGGNSPADALSLFSGSAADGNWSRYDNAAWADTVTTANTLAALQAAEQALADACPAIPLYAAPRVYGLAHGVSGVTPVPFCNRLDFRHAVK